MLDISEVQWLEFHEMVEVNGPSIISTQSDEIVFRGNDGSITLDYVRHPYEDAEAFVDILNNDPGKFKDAGFHTVLAIAKSLEMHIRLLFLGEEKRQFENNSFHLSKCLNAMRNIAEGKTQEITSVEGFQNKQFKPSGWRWENYCSGEKKKQIQLINMAFKIYKKGNPYRHNQVKCWSEVESMYEKTHNLFKEFIKIFDELMK